MESMRVVNVVDLLYKYDYVNCYIFKKHLETLCSKDMEMEKACQNV